MLLLLSALEATYATAAAACENNCAQTNRIHDCDKNERVDVSQLITVEAAIGRIVDYIVHAVNPHRA